ncbi:hypothetical protein D3C76_752110 [compost metagenome]
MPAIFAELHRVALAVDHLELLPIEVGRIPSQLGQNVLAQDGARHMPGRVEHDGADLAGEDGGGPLLLADDDATGEDLAAGLHHAQAVIRDVDQHVATGEVIHQIPAPQVAQQQAGTHLRPGIEPGAGLTADDAVGGQAMAALELLDGLFCLGVIGGILVVRGTVPQLVEDGADLAKLGSALPGSQGRHVQGRPMLGHGHGQQLAHFIAYGLIFGDLGPELLDLIQQVVTQGLVGQGLGQIELEGLHLLAGDQIHGAPGLLETRQLAEGFVIEGATPVGRGLLQLLPEPVEIRVQLGKHRLLQLQFQLMARLFCGAVLIPVMLDAGTGHHHLFCAGMDHASRPAAQPDKVCQCQPILLTHAYLKSVHFGLSGATVRCP